MSLISIKNLSFSYYTSTGSKVPVLKDINLDVEAGELIAIQGPSGSGKSTLLYIIGCLLNSYQGQVKINDQDIASLSDEELAILRNQSIGFVFQQFQLLPKATVWDNILLPSHYPSELTKHHDLSSRAERLVADLGLQEHTKHFPNQLSGGQQQRVAIARALLNDTQIILADEPTGSLDTHNSQQIMELLKTAHRSGRTVIIITHEPEVAQQCEKIVYFRDGIIKEIVSNDAKDKIYEERRSPEIDRLAIHWNPPLSRFGRTLKVGLKLVPLAFESLKQNRSRSLLTMVGIVIGVAAVLSMVTIGSFTKQKILDSYAEMGVNTLVFYGYPNWELRATDQVSTGFQSFDWQQDILPLDKIFPEIALISPTLTEYNSKVSFGGKVIDSDVNTLGVSSDGLRIANRQLILGNGFSPYHIDKRSNVCVIGYEIFERLFKQMSPLGQIIYLNQNEGTYACRVIGVLATQTSNKAWLKPNLQIYLPYTYFQGISNPWSSRIYQLLVQVKPGSDVEATGKKLKALFKKKYGKAGRFEISSDSVLLSQMKRFLGLFTLLLTAIALVSLTVGGIGITNMMLVSVSERFKEIGIRKAFGATNFSIRVQYLLESLLLCSIGGLAGLLVGFVLYEGAIFGATKFISSLAFQWTFDMTALFLSVISILVVGILSGLTPAWKAEKLQVIEALRSE